MCDIAVGTRMWIVVSCCNWPIPETLRKAVKHEGTSSPEMLVPINMIRKSKRGWHWFRHLASGAEFAMLNGWSETPKEAISRAILNTVGVICLHDRDTRIKRDVDSEPPYRGETSRQSMARYGFESLRELYRLYDEQKSERVGI